MIRRVPCGRVGERVLPMEHIGSGTLSGLGDADGVAVDATGEGG